MLFPDVCAVCDTPVSGEELELGICRSCWHGIREIGPHVCFQCGLPLGSSEVHESFKQFKCSSCRGKKRIPYSALRSLYYYQSPLREIFHLFKFGGYIALGERLAARLAEALEENSYFCQVDLVVPVPLHPMRQLKRGFNQSEILARRIGRQLGLPLELKAVARSRHTRPQSLLETSERGGNLKGAFKVDSNLVKKKTILLVDDVVTTGTTINECCRSLKRAGASEVKAVTLARAESIA